MSQLRAGFCDRRGGNQEGSSKVRVLMVGFKVSPTNYLFRLFTVVTSNAEALRAQPDCSGWLDSQRARQAH